MISLVIKHWKRPVKWAERYRLFKNLDMDIPGEKEMLKNSAVRVLLTALITLALCFCIPVGQVSAESGTKVKIKVGRKTFNAVFYDNDTSKALLESMPMKLKMSELNGNEKYRYLNKDFPTNEKRVKRVRAGDIMLYGSDCLVVFYKSFNTTYEYTKIGRITNPKGLKKAAGKKSVTVAFSKKKIIRLSEKKLTLNPGNSKTIKLKGASAKKVKWSTSNKKVATVSKGKIKAKKTGTVTITAKYKNKKYKCKVVVREMENPAPDKTVNEDVDSKETDGIYQEETDKPTAEKILTMKIGDKDVAVEWENNESVAALRDLVSESSLTIQMSMYGGFEQVGPVGTSLPRNDVQTTTSAGDIVLYSGNQIVVFYGSNSWAYTRLGRITDKDAAEIADLLGNGNVTITISE